MINNFPESMPEPHRRFTEILIKTISEDIRFIGISAGGSFLTNQMDKYSDLDFELVVESDSYSEVMESRKEIAESLGDLLSCFTGEHVGEPRILICLYDNPLLHVDLKFIDTNDKDAPVPDGAIIWERGNRYPRAKQKGKKSPVPARSPQWYEDRFWVWVHYIAVKIGRGELFEAIDGITFIRGNVLGPNILRKTGYRPTGVRRIEMHAPEYIEKLKKTISNYDPKDCIRALKETASLYRELRKDSNEIELKDRAEMAAIKYLKSIEESIS